MRLIIDGNNLAQRIWHVLPMLTTSSGRQISTTFGVIKTIRSSIIAFQPEEVHVTWDGIPTVRKSIFSGYKEKRQQKKEEYTPAEEEEYKQFKYQIAELFDILPLFGIHQYKKQDVEADDIVSVLAKRGKAVILSEDKDFLQLVSKNIKLFRPMANVLYTIDNFEIESKKIGKCNLGLPNPEIFLQSRFITGDASDEIPGVPGFAEGRTWPLILEYKTAANVLNAAKNLPGKLMSTLVDSRDIIVRNAMLMDLKYSERYISEDINNFKCTGLFTEKEIKNILLSLEFYSYMKNIQDFISPFRGLK